MLKTQRDVHTFMKAMPLPLPHEDEPGYININSELLRALVKEEAQEFDDAMLCLSICSRRNGEWRRAATRFARPEDKDRLEAMDDEEFTLYWWAEVIDAIVDSIVVLQNASNAMGIDIEPFWDEVQRANMAKADGPYNELGKKLKPKGWQPPKMLELLKETLEAPVKRFELAVAWSHGEWESGLFFNARNEAEAHSKLEEELGGKFEKIWTVGIFDIEEDDG